MKVEYYYSRTGNRAKFGFGVDNVHQTTQQQANREERNAKRAALRAKVYAAKDVEKNEAKRAAAVTALEKYNSNNVKRDLTSFHMSNSDLKALLAYIRLFEELPPFQANRNELLNSLADRTKSNLNEYFQQLAGN